MASQRPAKASVDESRLAGSNPAPSAECGEICHRCDRICTVWFAESPLWNAVIRGGSIDGDPEYGDMVCPTCFTQLAEEKGIVTRFRVSAEVVNVELETTTPSGRVWNEDRWHWDDPVTPTPGWISKERIEAEVERQQVDENQPVGKQRSVQL